MQVCVVLHRKHNQVAENKEGTLPVGSGVAGPISQRQAHDLLFLQEQIKAIIIIMNRLGRL